MNVSLDRLRHGYEVVSSEEDSAGSLKDFVVSDDDDSYGSPGGEEVE